MADPETVIRELLAVCLTAAGAYAVLRDLRADNPRLGTHIPGLDDCSRDLDAAILRAHAALRGRASGPAPEKESPVR